MNATTLSIPTAETGDHNVTLTSAIAVQSGGWSPDELRAMVAQEIELRSIIVDYYRSQMHDKKHYYTLQAGQKPALSKEGALNLCSLFKVRVAAEPPSERYHDDSHYSVRYRVHLVSMRSGMVVADGDGSCSTRESKYAYRWVKPSDVPETIDTAMLTKRNGRYGVQYRMPTSDIADHYNTVLKMAYKRAIVAVALCLPLVSELFTQDLEETWKPTQSPPAQSAGQRQRREAPPAEPQAESSPRDPAPVSQQVSPHQLKQLWSQINHHRVDHEAFRVYLTQLGIRSTKELTPAQLEQCLSEMDTRKGRAFEPHDATDAETDTPSQGARAELFKALTILQAEIAQTEQAQEPGEPHAQTLIDLAQWVPRVARACEYPDTPEPQLNTYLLEVNQALAELRAMMTEAAA